MLTNVKAPILVGVMNCIIKMNLPIYQFTISLKWNGEPFKWNENKIFFCITPKSFGFNLLCHQTVVRLQEVSIDRVFPSL